MKTRVIKHNRTRQQRIRSQDRYERTRGYIKTNSLNKKPDPKFRNLYSFGVVI